MGGNETELLPDRLGELLQGDGEGGVLFCYHRDGVRRVPLARGSSWTIGREAPAGILIRDSSLSRQHARLIVAPSGELTIQDLGSTNGTLINGVRVDAGPIRLGDVVTLGAVTLALHLVGGDEQPISLESNDRFLARLAEEVIRARTFRRRFTLLMIRAEQGHVSRWLGRIHTLLRAVDHVGLYSPSCVEVLLPETDAEAAIETAERIASELKEVAPALALAGYPGDATSVGALVEHCQQALCACDQGVQSVCSLPARSERPNTAAEATPFGPAMQELYALADRVAESSASVLILGETGVGKEVLARRVHAHSQRRRGKFLAINCGAIPPQLVESTLFGHEQGAFTGASARREGLFESANKGTILLDEIGELPLEAQATLLRALDTRRITRVGSTREIEVNVRILTATHRDLEAMVEHGDFRQDLLYRLNTVVLQVPPLRDRRDEISPLVSHFVGEAARANRRDEPGIDEEAISLLETHHWPGNLRELRNAIERAVVICQDGLITADDLPASVRRGGPVCLPAPDDSDTSADLDFKELVLQYESMLILEALRVTAWNQSAAARRLRIPRRTLVHKMRALGIRRLGYEVAGTGDGQ